MKYAIGKGKIHLKYFTNIEQLKIYAKPAFGNSFPIFFHNFCFILMQKSMKTIKKHILSIEHSAQHPLTGQHIQHRVAYYETIIISILVIKPALLLSILWRKMLDEKWQKNPKI